MPNPLILIVEDDPNSRKLLRDVLGVTGYRTLESETAEEGLRLAFEHRPDLVLMDIRLPGMSGIDALKLLRNDTEMQGIPVVAVTASAMTHHTREVMSAGFDALERKPISVSALLNTVRDLLARRPVAP
jgi:two-component system cell cycle response regulator DivK